MKRLAMDMPARHQTSLIAGFVAPDVKTLDERLDEVLPVDPHRWSQSEKDIYIVRVCGMLLDDMGEQFESHQQRDRRGELVFRDEHDRTDFIAMVGWVCGYWRGTIPFDLATQLYGFDADTIRDATMQAYARELHMAREFFADHYRLH